MVLSGHKNIFSKVKQTRGKAGLNFVFNFNPCFTASEGVGPLSENLTIFLCFLLAVTSFFTFSKFFKTFSFYNYTLEDMFLTIFM